MKRIGLTGSIAAGKSTVSNRLRALSAFVLDADQVAREVVGPGTEGLRRVLSAFDVSDANGNLDRKALARIVFADAKRREALNAILHPLVLSEMERQAELSGEAVVMFDVPLLFESGMAAGMDEVWLVDAPEEVRVGRIMARDGATREEALLRMAAQMPDAQKRALADEIINNAADIAALYERVDQLWRNVLREQHG